MYSAHDITHIVTKFKDRTLPKAEWTHRAHMIVAVAFLKEYGLKASVPLLRDGIKEYNVSAGGVNTDSDGYHETVTMYWIIQINAYMKEHPITSELHDWINDMFTKDFTGKNTPFDYYSEGLFASVLARKNWVEPNIKALEIPEEMGLRAFNKQ